MDRKKTILITALINAALLVVLFVAALHHEDGPPLRLQSPQPLFHDAPQDLSLAPAEPTALLFPERVSYPLPPIALSTLKESPPAPLPQVLPPMTSSVSSCLEVSVKKGDTLEKIAKAHKTSVEDILQANQLSGHFLRIGQVLKIPHSENSLPNRPKAGVQEISSLTSKTEYYVVKVGDNPWSVAMKHHMKVDELLKLNQMSEEKARRLKPGDRLRIR